jgi:hypothetical protein
MRRNLPILTFVNITSNLPLGTAVAFFLWHFCPTFFAYHIGRKRESRGTGDWRVMTTPLIILRGKGVFRNGMLNYYRDILERGKLLPAQTAECFIFFLALGSYLNIYKQSVIAISHRLRPTPVRSECVPISTGRNYVQVNPALAALGVLVLCSFLLLLSIHRFANSASGSCSRYQPTRDLVDASPKFS